MSPTGTTPLRDLDRIVGSAGWLNTAIYQSFSRQLRASEMDRLLEYWVPALELGLERQALGYLAHRICMTEDMCTGRLAGSLQGVMLRVMTARSIKRKTLDILEIGALFGINVAVLHETTRGLFDSVHITVIDPLAGYYDTGALDPICRVPVTTEIFEHNLKRMNIPNDDITAIRLLSTEADAEAQAAARQYDVLLIDGDHTYAGVKNDFDRYHGMVKSGGYIIFDDYKTKHWPDIEAFVDKEVRPRTDFECVGAQWHTAIFRSLCSSD